MSDKYIQASDWQPGAVKTMRFKRAQMLKSVRAFFDVRDVLEVETPLLSRYSVTDPHLESLASEFRGQKYFLNTSPEYAMKRLLVDDPQAIYQICKAFRDDERGRYHNPEFTMLEWYQPGYGMRQLMDELAALIEVLLVDSKIQFEYVSFQQAFEVALGFNPHHVTSEQCYQIAIDFKVDIPQGLTSDDNVNHWLDWLLTQKVLPAFAPGVFTFLYDYPTAQCALAKIELNAQRIPVAKRFELFFGEIELANGFYELTDADEQLSRFEKENQQRKQGGNTVTNIDKNFIAALAHGLPDCSGVAVGLDRLLMVLTQAESIDQVLSFPWNKI